MKFVLGLILIFASNIISQDIPSTSTGDLRFYVDYSAFKGQEGKTYQEFYLMIHADQLNFIGSENKNATFQVSSVIKNQDDEIISEQEWITDAVLNQDSISLKSLAVYDQWAALLDAGSYSVLVNVVEQEQKKSGLCRFEINIPSFGDENFVASELEFISKINDRAGESHFEKNGKDIIPNPWRRYGLLIPKLSFYYEIYNIKNPTQEKYLTINYSILDKNNVVVKKLSGISVKKSGVNISVVHAIDLSDLNSGICTLSAEVIDSTENQKCFVKRTFENIQADYLINSSLLSEEEAEREGKLLEYIGTPGEYNKYEELTLNGKAQFLANFWKEKDATPGTAENEFLNTIMQRYAYANQNFSWNKTEGFKTDKGRVLIKYGMPDEIQSYNAEADVAPYEIWQYNQDRSFIFVFGDINSNGNFVLLHSTKEGEISNYYWMDYLRSF